MTKAPAGLGGRSGSIRDDSCAACGSDSLELHLRVAGEAGPNGLIPTTDRFGTALSDIVRCRACGHMQLERLPPSEVLSDAYAEARSEDYLAEEAGQRETARVALRRIESHVRTGALLDVGCWFGFLLDEARRRGWRTVGVEPSVAASAYARRQLGLEVHNSDLASAELEPSSFDAVVLADVLEHFPDPAVALERVSELLRPGGVLYLALPDAGGRVARAMGSRWWSVIPTHVHYFTRHSLATLLARGRWDLLEMDTAPKAFTVLYYLGRLGGYSPPVARWLVRLATGAGIASRTWAPDFRDRVCVTARKPEVTGR